MIPWAKLEGSQSQGTIGQALLPVSAVTKGSNPLSLLPKQGEGLGLWCPRCVCPPISIDGKKLGIVQYRNFSFYRKVFENQEISLILFKDLQKLAEMFQKFFPRSTEISQPSRNFKGKVAVIKKFLYQFWSDCSQIFYKQQKHFLGRFLLLNTEYFPSPDILSKKFQELAFRQKLFRNFLKLFRCPVYGMNAIYIPLLSSHNG